MRTPEEHRERWRNRIKDFCAALWSKDLYDHQTIEVVPFKQGWTITIAQMYSFVPLHFSHLKQISAYFGTDDLRTSNDSSPGCETCDYGSTYTLYIYIDHDKGTVIK